MKKLVFLLLTFLLNFSIHAQSFVDDFDDTASVEEVASDLPTEKIEKISASGRIFIITNTNQSFSKGDFISLIKFNKLVTRALVAKDTNGIAGIKILKTYSLDLFKDLRVGDEVKVLRGDDSFFKVKKKEETETSKINEEEDLYNEDLITEDDLDLNENKNRAIKTDNIISASLGFLDTIDKDQNSIRLNQFNASWAYQFDDNIWGEVLYGEGTQKNFPDDGLGTKITNLTVRGKYTFAGPMFTYFQPYAGFQIINADSPGAGQPDAQKTDPVALQKELDLVDSLKEKRVIFGVTVLKRLVPGWFMRGDFGNDMLNVGFSLEF
ncbi:hypothetical protein [Bacteriovorax sp. BSW11_IV]|uniref:hypothetical protein n=1 Tax=Bacteriovorax sp. BSW11_IV TaxID=1353529 RepID=UPI000558824A|nr:hypothetical protein [Bacteriovorax sp. BSW11_IV]